MTPLAPLTKSPAKIITLIVIGPIIAQFIWWLLDHELPYKRFNGYLEPADPIECGLPPSDVRKIVPGACVHVRWQTHSVRNCRPAGRFNVTRTIKDAQGLHTLPAIDSVYSSDRAADPMLIRPMVLPINSPVGPAHYDSSACFVCNPLQATIPSLLKRCVSEPGIDYEVEMPEPISRGLQGIPGIQGVPGTQGPQGIPGQRGP